MGTKQPIQGAHGGLMPFQSQIQRNLVSNKLPWPPCITAKPFSHLMEVDLLEDGKGPADEDGPLDVVLGHVDRLDLLLGAHHGHGGAVAVTLIVADAVVVVIVDLVEDGGRAADLVVLEARAEDVGRLVEEGVPGDPGGVLDEEPPFGHAEAERKKKTSCIFKIFAKEIWV